MAKIVTNQVLLTELNNLTSLIQKHMDSDEKHFDQIYSFLDGNGKPGLKTRIDRMEQLEVNRKWHLGYLWTAMVSGFVAFFFGK